MNALFHGSPVPDLRLLDPSRCVVDPSAWAGVSVAGIKQTDPVVWLTPDFDVAIAFALKAHVRDLAVDAREGVLYLVGGPLPEDAHGYVYTVPRGPPCREVNPLEWASAHPLTPSAVVRVGLHSFRRLIPRQVERLPSLH